MTVETQPTTLERAWRYGDLLCTGLIIVGAFMTVLVGRAGAIVMLAGLLGSLSIHLVVATIQYRRVMTRAWPEVRPIDDDDW